MTKPLGVLLLGSIVLSWAGTAPAPTAGPSLQPSLQPSPAPTAGPSRSPTGQPSTLPTLSPAPTSVPTLPPSLLPTASPTLEPTPSPSYSVMPTPMPTWLLRGCTEPAYTATGYGGLKALLARGLPRGTCVHVKHVNISTGYALLDSPSPGVILSGNNENCIFEVWGGEHGVFIEVGHDSLPRLVHVHARLYKLLTSYHAAEAQKCYEGQRGWVSLV